MNLADLDAEWIFADGVTVGIIFRCPVHPKVDEYDGHLGSVMFANPFRNGCRPMANPGEPRVRGIGWCYEHKLWCGHQPYQDVPLWHRTGETFETLTLTPSILRRGACEWHGYITNGEVTTA